jgi:hypothetical protein
MQDWVGTYIINSMCNTTICCCFTGDMLFVNYSTQVLGLSSDTDGDCNDNTPFAVNITYPNYYTGGFMMGKTSIIMTLSSDSQSIAIVYSANPACNSNALRENNSIKPQTNIMILLSLIFVRLMMNIM